MITCSRFVLPMQNGSVIDGFTRGIIMREIEKHSEQCWSAAKTKAKESPSNFVRHDVLLSTEIVEFLRPHLLRKMTQEQIDGLIGRTAKTVSTATVENKIHIELEF